MDEREIIEAFFTIPDKEGRDVPFIFNPLQLTIYEELTLRDIILKARQLGISTFIVALMLARCLSRRNRRCVSVSHSSEATQKLIDKVHYILSHLRGGLVADLKYNSRSELYFNKTDSIFYMGTAGNVDVGVGDTITDLHCSEVSRWSDPIELLKGLFNCVPPTGNVWIESTGRGMGNYYHQLCVRALKEQSQYRLHFVDWRKMPEYSIPLSPPELEAMRLGLDEALEEPPLLEKGILSLEQMMWRRRKIEEMNYDIQAFKEQYPLSFDECFQGAGASYFKRVNYMESGVWHSSERFKNLHVFGGHPYQGQTYFAGVDVGGGVGRDSTVLEVFSIDDMCQVAEWTSNLLEPHLAAQAHAPILEFFNNCYVNPERNNHGVLYIKELIDCYQSGARIHMSRPPKDRPLAYGKIADYGTYTSVKNRYDVISSLRTFAAEDFTIYSPVLKSEMDSFVENDRGRLEAQEGCFDDHVMAGAHALYVFEKVAAMAGKPWQEREVKPTDPFSLDFILKELEERAAVGDGY